MPIIIESEGKTCRTRWLWRRVFQKAGTFRVSKACTFVLFLLVDQQPLHTLETCHRVLTESVPVVLQLIGEVWGEFEVNLYRPRNKIDWYRISLHSSVAVESWESHCPPR